MNELHAMVRTPPVLFEGAMGTALQQRGLPAGQPGELFTLRNPDAVAEVHRAYVRAGAHVLKTNTFNANPLRLERTGLAGESATCNRQAAAIARQVATEASSNGGRPCLVAGSIGPTGVLLEPAGAGKPDDCERAYLEQAEVLAESGVDLFLVETMYDLREAQAALAACRRVSDRPVVVTLTFSHGRRGFVTMLGDAAGDALMALVDAGAFAVGTNCNLDSLTMVPLTAAMRRHVPGPIVIQPCAGQPRLVGTEMSYPESADEFAANMLRIVAHGAQMIGGCCGTTEAYIERIRELLEERPA